MTRYVRFIKEGVPSWGLLDNDKIQVLTRAPYLGGKESGADLDAEGVELLAPCEPSKILCVGTNYYDHVKELNFDTPATPILFIKPSTCVNDPGATLLRPRSSQRLDYEGELAFVVGKTAKRVSAAQSTAYIFGYTILNDVTARDL